MLTRSDVEKAKGRRLAWMKKEARDAVDAELMRGPVDAETRHREQRARASESAWVAIENAIELAIAAWGTQAKPALPREIRQMFKRMEQQPDPKLPGPQITRSIPAPASESRILV